MTSNSASRWVLALASVASLMVALDTLVVSTALTTIRSDLGASIEELESKGVSFKGDTIDSGVCHQALFEDPDGNSLDLHHRYAPFQR